MFRRITNPQPPRICLLGASLEVANLGVRALAGSLIRLMEESHPGARITMLYGNKEGGPREVNLGGTVKTVEVVNFRLSPRARLQEHLLWILLLALLYRAIPLRALRGWILQKNLWLRTLAEATLVGDINGGDSFSDIYGLRRFICGVLPLLTAILVGQRPVLLPQTFGPYKTRIARGLARWIMKQAGVIYARDLQSCQLVRKMLGRRGEGMKIEFCPDVAFTLAAADPAVDYESSLPIEPPQAPDDSRPLIGINVSGLLYAGGYRGDNMFGLSCDYKSLIEELIRRILARTEARIVLIPHLFGVGVESDEFACWRVFGALSAAERARVCRITRPCDERQIKGLIGLCDFFIGSRMHSCIAAISQGIPSISLAYSQKFAGVFESAGVGWMVLDARAMTHEDLLGQCLARLRDRAAIAELLKARVPKIQSKIRMIFQEMLAGGTAPRRGAKVYRNRGLADVAAEH